MLLREVSLAETPATPEQFMSAPAIRTESNIIDGKSVAASIIENVKKARDELMTAAAVKPGLAVVIVGEDPASQVYVRN